MVSFWFVDPRDHHLNAVRALPRGDVEGSGEAASEAAMRALWEVADFLSRVRRQLRFGQLSRAPIRLLRLEVRGDTAECEWVARSPDDWDADLPPGTGKQHASLQALEDCLAVRKLLFSALPSISMAVFRVYRGAEREQAELIITGTVTREDSPALNVCSLAMQAQLCGLKFWLADGVLGRFQSEDCSR